MSAVSPHPATARLTPVLPSEPVWPLTVAQYHEMVRYGILTEEDRVELLEGVLVPKMSKNPPHTTATGLILEAIRPLLPPGWFLNSQEPVTLDDGEPEPDYGHRQDYGRDDAVPVVLAGVEIGRLVVAELLP